MGQNQDTRVFNGVMDQDSAPFTIDSANVRYRLNLVNLYNDNGFASNENIQGFEMVSNSYLSTSRNKCIGAFEDVRGNSIIYFVWAEDATHGIYRWYQNKGGLNGQLEKVYQGSVLGFEEYHRISHCSLVDELLIYTDGYGSPKSLNIGRMNQTNKRKIFNIYFDQAAFGLPTTYTLELYIGTGYVFTWTSAATDYIGRVDDFILAAQADVALSTYCKVESRVKYAQVILNEIGDYMINVSPSAFVVAENFYPDVTPTPVSYASMNEELITAIKYPPFKAPTAKYIQTQNLGKSLKIQYATTFTDPGLIEIGWMGMNNNSTSGFYDTTGLSVLGQSNLTAQGGSFVVPQPLSYFENTGASNVTIAFNLNFDIQPTGSLNGITIYFAKYTSPNLPMVSPIVLYPNPSSIISRSFQFNVTFVPNVKWGIWIFNANSSLQMSATITGIEVKEDLVNSIVDKAYQFRAKYIYKDEQDSVYGAISSIPFPISYFEDSIEIDFSDPRLSIPELVCDIKEVVLSVSDDNGTTWYDFKTLSVFEFISNQKWVYTESQIGIPVASSVANLPYHNIPLTAKSQEFIDDRIFYGATLTGYDPITVDIKFNTTYTSLDDITNINELPPRSTSHWRRGGEYLIGIVYYDDADRCSPVILDYKNSRIKIPLIKKTLAPLPSYDQILAPADIDCEIYHEPPSWATKYQMVRTKDLSQTNYLMWAADNITYVDLDDVPQTLPQKYIRISFENIPYYTEKENKGTKITFAFTEKSRIKFLTDLVGGFIDNDHEIVKVDGTYVYIKNEGSVPVPGLASAGALCVIYDTFESPIADKTFYEFGECYPIKKNVFSGITRSYHEGNTSNQSYGSFNSTSTPAKVSFSNGDVFYRTRVMPTGVAQPVVGSITFYISSSTPNDKIPTTYNNYGRLKAIDINGQKYNPTEVIFTNRYISGTKINGLNAVEAANTRQYSTIYGDLNKMQVVNNDVLKFIFGNGYQLSIYVNQGVIRQTGGASNLISIYDDVAGNSHLIQRTLGTQNAESVVLNDEGDVFGWDETEGVDWLSASNATLQVSDYNMKNTFGNYGLQRRKLDTSKSNAPAVYDLYRDLMILTLAPLQARQFIAPTATVKLADLDSLGWNIQVIVQPQGLTKTYTTPPSVSWYDIVRDALPTTYGMSQNADGSFNVLAPDYTNYKDSVLILSGTSLSTGVTTTINYSFTGGQEASNEPEFSGVTLAYSRKLKGWVTYFSYLPEMYGRLRNQVASFKDGQLWLHDKSNEFNNFYGVNYPSQLRFVLNKDYPKVKSPLSVWYRGLGSWGAIVKYTPNNMETEMIPSSFRLQENGYSAAVTRDRNDPRFTDVQQAWVNGQEIRGDAIEIELYNNDLSQARIDSQKSVYLYSELS